MRCRLAGRLPGDPILDDGLVVEQDGRRHGGGEVREVQLVEHVALQGEPPVL